MSPWLLLSLILLSHIVVPNGKIVNTNIFSSSLAMSNLLQIKDLRVGQWKEPYIGFTQENSIENSVQDSLPYIQIPNGLYKLFLAYPKCLCILHVV